MKINTNQTQTQTQSTEQVQETEKYPSWMNEAIKETEKTVDLSKDVHFNKNDVLALKKIIFAIFSGLEIKLESETKENFIICTLKNGDNDEKIASFTLPIPKKK